MFMFHIRIRGIQAILIWVRLCPAPCLGKPYLGRCRAWLNDHQGLFHNLPRSLRRILLHATRSHRSFIRHSWCRSLRPNSLQHLGVWHQGLRVCTAIL
jgi:hypothetical protein